MKKMKRCVIVGGADINNYGFIRDKLCADDYIVFCDSGLKHLEQLQVKPNLIVGNVSILLYLDSLGKKGCIIDDYSEMEIVSDKPVCISDQYAFFSLLNITGCAKGITITGAKSPLQMASCF